MTFHEKLLELGAVREALAGLCVCDLGRRRVAALSPLTDAEALNYAINLVREMMKLAASRREPPIHGLRDAAAHLKKVARERAILEPGELLELRDFCDTAGRMQRFFEALDDEVPQLHALAMPLQGLPALVRSIDEKIAPNQTVRDTASDLLHQLRSEIFSVEQSIQRDLQRMVRGLTESGDLQDDFFTLRNERYVLPVKTSNRGKVQGIIHDSSNTGETVFIEPFEILEQSNRLADLRLREREEIFRILLRVAGHIRDELNALLTNETILAEFDLVFAKTRFATAHKCAFPAVTDHGKPLNLVDAHHPLLYISNPEASRPLNLALNTADRVLVITGPNAGGKTTALKTLGLTALMVQCAIPAPLSARSRLPIFSNVLADIGDEQSILEGYSTFSAHMKRMVEILRAADFASLVLLDELGTATDPAEGSALAVAILEHLSRRGTLAIVSTHLSALKNWAFNYEGVRNASFRLSESDHRPTFHLTLDVPGISEALIIAEQVGMPAEIIARARALRPDADLDATGLLLALQKKEQQLAEEVSAAEKHRIDLESERGEVEELREKLQTDKRTYRNKLLAQKEREVAELKAKVESLIARQPSKKELVDTKRDLEAELAGVETQREEPLRSRVDVPGASKPLQKGDYVRVARLNEEGKVVEVFEKRGEVRVALGKLNATLKLREVERISAPDKESAGTASPEGMVQYRRPTDMSSSIDLHGARAEEAVSRIDKFIDQAIAAGLDSVRIVHGQGSGALRRAIHEHLRLHPIIRAFRFGAPNEGGGSVTIAEFR